MKKSKKHIFCILFLTFLNACNFPLRGQNTTDQQISTQVALAQTQTRAVTIEKTKAIPQETPLQNDLPPTITMTITETTTPTPIISDPAIQLGVPVWANPMDNGSAFGIDNTGYDDGYTSVAMSGGAMILRSQTTTGWKGWRLTDRGMSNFYLEGRFIIGPCSSNDQFGLVFRAPDYSSGTGYYFGVNCDAKFYLWRSDGNGIYSLIDKTSSDQIVIGENSENRLGVLAKGDNIQLFINGQKVGQISDSTFTLHPKIGVFIAGMNTPGFTVKVDQINLWNP